MPPLSRYHSYRVICPAVTPQLIFGYHYDGHSHCAAQKMRWEAWREAAVLRAVMDQAVRQEVTEEGVSRAVRGQAVCREEIVAAAPPVVMAGMELPGVTVGKAG